MNNISLTQVTAFVAAICMASFLVNADDALNHNHEGDSIAQTESPKVAEVIEAADEPGERFTFTSLDTDKNGKLSHQEVIAGKNVWLVKSFKQIDANTDESLIEQELVDFVAKTTASSR